MEMGRSLAATLGERPAALMRGHGCVVAGRSLREVVFDAVHLELNANLQMRAMALSRDIVFLSDGEIAAMVGGRSSFTFERAWERWSARAGRPYRRPADD